MLARLVWVSSAFLALVLGAPARAQEFRAGDLIVTNVWSRPTMPGMHMGVAYLTITNSGAKADALVSASTPAADAVEFHRTTVDEGVARMRPVPEIALPAGSTVKAEPGGLHFMIVGLKAPLERGTTVPMTLKFRDAGTIEVRVKIEMTNTPPRAEHDMIRMLGTVTVTARRASSLPTQIPTTIEGITSVTIERTINAVDSEDALKYFPSLNVRKRYIGDYDHAVLASRASGTGNSARSLVYADGILLSNLLGNGATFTPRWGLVTPEEIERVDVLYGPFSAAYSGNSVGAVVDYVTRMPEEFELHAKLSNYSQEFDVYSSHDRFTASQLSASAGDRHGGFSWWINLSRTDSRGHPLSYVNRAVAGAASSNGIAATGAIEDTNPRGQPWWILGSTSQIHTVQDHAKAKLAYEVDDTFTASYLFAAWRNDAERHSATYLHDAAGEPIYSGEVNIAGRLYSLTPNDFAPARNDLLHMIHGVSLRYSPSEHWDVELAASAYDYRDDLTRTATTALPAALAGGAGRVANQDGTGWRTFALRSVWRPGFADSHEIELGAQLDDYQLATTVSQTDDWLRGSAGARLSGFRGRTELAAVYLQDTWTLDDRWRAMLGARLERWRAFDGAIQNATNILAFAQRDDFHLSPKAALAFQATESWLLKASTGRAIRNPTVSELFQGSIAANAIVNNDPNLKPERSWTHELTSELERSVGSWRVTLFHEDSYDALYMQTNATVTPSVTNIQNVDHIRTSGVETVLRAQDCLVTGLDLSTSFTWARSRILANDNFPQSVGKHQPRVPEFRAHALASWRIDERWVTTLGARYSGTQYNTLDNADFNGFTFTGTSEFLVFDARVRYRFNDHWTASLGVDNLSNERYWAFHPYTQRTFGAELSADL